MLPVVYWEYDIFLIQIADSWVCIEDRLGKSMAVSTEIERKKVCKSYA